MKIRANDQHLKAKNWARELGVRDRSFITSQGGGGGGGGGGAGGVQFLKRVNFGGSVLKMYKV